MHIHTHKYTRQEAVTQVRMAETDEALTDLQALYDLKYFHHHSQKQTEESGHKRPVKVSKYKQCEDAKLDQLVESFTITAGELAENLSYRGRHQPKDPAEDPVTAAISLVPHAENYGFRDAGGVLSGAKYLAAKRIAFNPEIRAFVREKFDKLALITVRNTKLGQASAEVYHTGLLTIVERPHREIYSEEFLEMCKARNARLVDVSIRLAREDHEYVTKMISDVYMSGSDEDDHSKAWEKLRQEILEEALTNNLYPLLESELINRRARMAKLDVADAMRDRLEKLLQVAPYVWKEGDSKTKSPSNIMAINYAQPTEMVIIDKLGEVWMSICVYVCV
jgi:transcriptional accessory protein Tex/SPT6